MDSVLRAKFALFCAAVQIGAFTTTARADAFVRRLRADGLPLLRQDFPRGGGLLRVLYAGPFASPRAAAAARDTVRAMGFADAFTWAHQTDR